LSVTPISELSYGDIRFLVSTVDSALMSKIDSISGDPDIIESLMEQGARKVFRRIILLNENEITTSITPRFLFEILLRTAQVEVENQGYTIERTPSLRIPVFDSQDIVGFLRNKDMIKYLSNMLTSFTRIHSYTIPIRIRKGIWRRIRFNDMDIDSLLRYCQTASEESRFSIYKRIADLCLFLLGMFPEYIEPNLPNSFTNKTSQKLFGRVRRSAEEYEEEGKRFYKLAGEHRGSYTMGLSNALWQLHEQFDFAKKSLNFISENLLQFRKVNLFPSLS
jgi:hypothetical protein